MLFKPTPAIAEGNIQTYRNHHTAGIVKAHITATEVVVVAKSFPHPSAYMTRNANTLSNSEVVQCTHAPRLSRSLVMNKSLYFTTKITSAVNQKSLYTPLPFAWMLIIDRAKL